MAIGSRLLRAAAPLLLALPATSGERLVYQEDAAAPWRRVAAPRFAAPAMALLAGVGAQELRVDPLVAYDRDQDSRISSTEYNSWLDDSIRAGDVLEEERDFYDALFLASDIDGDGKLCPAEIDYIDALDESWLHRPLDGQSAVSEEIAVLLANIDQDGDGMIDFREHSESIAECADGWGWEDRIDHPWVKRWIRLIFQVCDIDRDGRLREKEVHFSELIVRNRVRTLADFEATLRTDLYVRLDDDGNGVLEESEVTSRLALEAKALKDAHAAGHPVATFAPSIVALVGASYRECDLDGDGNLDALEVAKLAGHIATDVVFRQA